MTHFRSYLTALALCLGLGLATAAQAAAPPAKAPAKPAPAGNAKNGAALFAKTGCPGCHGPAGKGDGPAAAALNPKPRNFSDAKIMKTLKDAYLMQVISKGGLAFKKSPAMPMNPALTPPQLKDIVAFLRTLCKCQGPK